MTVDAKFLEIEKHARNNDIDAVAGLLNDLASEAEESCAAMKDLMMFDEGGS